MNASVTAVGARAVRTRVGAVLLGLGTVQLFLAHRAATVLGVAGVAGLALVVVASRWPDGLVGIGAAERLVVFPLRIWALVAGLAILRPPDAAG